MHKIILTAAIFGLSSTMAFAQGTPSFADIDTDTSGEVSFTELQAAWPDFTQADFDAADTDASGGLSADELAAIGTAVTTAPGNPPAATGADTVGNPSDDDNPASGTGDSDEDENEASPSGSTTN